MGTGYYLREMYELSMPLTACMLAEIAESELHEGPGDNSSQVLPGARDFARRTLRLHAYAIFFSSTHSLAPSFLMLVLTYSCARTDIDH